MKKTKIFFAYKSGDTHNTEAIVKGTREFNKHQNSFYVHIWEKSNIEGSVIDFSILEEIDDSKIFACDLTYQNHNVLFELGYAIAKRKELLILLNNTIKGALESYSENRVIKNIGYSTFSTSRQVISVLQKKEKEKGSKDFLSEIVSIEKLDCDTHDIFYMNSKVESQASMELDDYLNSTGLKLITNNTSEIEYQTLIWYITHLYKAKNIILHMTGENKINANKYNAEYSFYAGIGYGLGKKVLLVAPSPFNAPLDYENILIQYNNSEECKLKIKNWFEQQKITSEVIQPNELENQEAKVEKQKLNLLKLGIGYGVAEEEGDDLLEYFIEYELYTQSLKRTSSVIVGRKGTGKSALFIKLLNDYEKSSDVFNVIIKPDSEELLENVEFTKLYDNERSKKTLLITVWKFVFLSKLLQSIVNKIDKDNRQSIGGINHELLQFYYENTEKVILNFYGVVKHISKESSYYTDNPNILEPINNKFINPLANILIKYFKENKFKKIHLLCDNLDKAWYSKNDLTLQSEMILTLLEFSERISNTLKNSSLKSNTIIFLRQDIYDYILRESSEPDKMKMGSSFIEWAHNPEKLLEIVEERFKYLLEINEFTDIKDVWADYFDFQNSSDPGNMILKYIVPRPRDTIYFFSKLFESAVNKNLKQVDNTCIEYANKVYLDFLNTNLTAETKAEFPEIEKIMSKLSINPNNKKLSYKQFYKILHSVTKNKKHNYKIIRSLLDKQYIVGINEEDKNISYNNIEILLQGVNERKFFLKKNNIQILFHPGIYQ